MTEKARDLVIVAVLCLLFGALLLAIGMLQGEYIANERVKAQFSYAVVRCEQTLGEARTACNFFLDAYRRLYGAGGP